MPPPICPFAAAVQSPAADFPSALEDVQPPSGEDGILSPIVHAYKKKGKRVMPLTKSIKRECKASAGCARHADQCAEQVVQASPTMC